MTNLPTSFPMTAEDAPRPAEPVAFPSVREWKSIVAEFQKSSTSRAVWQLVNTLVPYAALWVGIYFAFDVSKWLVAGLAVLAGSVLVRVFIIFHDCGHGSFFESKRANSITGFITGMLTFTPYYQWRWEHSLHHATTGDLDRRGIGDVWTMTVQEYLDFKAQRQAASTASSSSAPLPPPLPSQTQPAASGGATAASDESSGRGDVRGRGSCLGGGRPLCC
jgi:hypothetical protein